MSHYGKEGLFELPKGWAWTSLGAIAVDMADGPFGSNLKREHYTLNKEARIIQLSNIGENGWREDNTKYTTFAHAESISRSIVSPGNLVIAKMMPAGRAIICPNLEKMYVLSSDAVKYVPSKELFNKYLLYAINSSVVLNQIHAEVQGVTRARTSIDKLRGYLIPIPPKEEQYRIVRSVDYWIGISNTIEQHQSFLSASIERIKAKILEYAIEGKLVSQKSSDEPAIELLKRINPFFIPSDNLHYGDRLPEGWTCGLFGELNQHRNKSEDPMASPKEEYELYSVPVFESGMPEFLHGDEIGSTKQLVSRGDVLLCKINPHLNRSWIVSHYRSDLKCIASSEWLVFSSPALTPGYARWFFISPKFKEMMLSNVSGVGGSLMRARLSAVNNYPIWVPPIEEQNRIVDAIETLFQLIDRVGNCING